MKRVIGVLCAVPLAAVLLLALPACDKAADPDNIEVGRSESAVNYGNGIFYFPLAQADFGNALRMFLAAHPDLEIVSMAPNDTGGYGSTRGYFVVFREKQCKK